MHQESSNAFGRIPLLVTRTFGAGKILFMGTDGAWRWRRGVEDLYHYRFWGQVVRWMSEWADDPTLAGLLAGPHEVVVVVSQPDRRRGRGRKTTPSPVSRTSVRAEAAPADPTSCRSGTA